VRALIAIAFVTGACAVHAQATDPLHSRECEAARVVLERALDDASAKKPGSMDALAKARHAAIEACLGREDAQRERSGAPYPAIATRPPAIEAPPVVLPAPPPPPLAIPRPSAITTCDPGGCWDSEGRRLNSVGPLLVGPRGACTVQAGIVSCP
jgi:hypothetical protein